MLRPLYALFGALAAASLTACLPLGEMYLIEQTPLVRWMASDPEYGLETYRSLGVVLPWLALHNGIAGAAIGWWCGGRQLPDSSNRR